jgi:hypothetical protein
MAVMGMSVVSRVIGLVGATLIAVSSAPVQAQDAPAPNPALSLTLTETIRRQAEEAAKRDDLRSLPTARGPAKLPDSFRVTVSSVDDVCWPGEERMMGIERARRANRSTRSR